MRVVNGAEAALGAAASGVGVTCVLSYQAADVLRTGTLVTLLPSFESPPLSVHLVHPSASATTT